MGMLKDSNGQVQYSGSKKNTEKQIRTHRWFQRPSVGRCSPLQWQSRRWPDTQSEGSGWAAWLWSLSHQQTSTTRQQECTWTRRTQQEYGEWLGMSILRNPFTCIGQVCFCWRTNKTNNTTNYSYKCFLCWCVWFQLNHKLSCRTLTKVYRFQPSVRFYL